MAHTLHPVRSDNSHLNCGVCNKTGHSNMMFCEKLLSYVLHKVKNWGRVPKVVCKICLNSDPAITPTTCQSTNPPYMCQVSEVSNAICKCEEIQEELQNHLHSHFNPAHGFKNIQIFLQATHRHPIIMDQWISLERITLSTLAGCLSELRQMYKLKLSDGSTMDAVCVESLKIRAVMMGVPKL